jgi:hypothetical protein
VAVDFELSRVLLPLRYYGHDLRTIADNNVMYLNEGFDVDSAVRAPMAPMKRNGDRALPQQFFEAH